MIGYDVSRLASCKRAGYSRASGLVQITDGQPAPDRGVGQGELLAIWVTDVELTLTSQAGVTDVVLAVNYRPEVMVSVLKKTEEEFGIKIHFSVETEPLGTGTSKVGRWRAVAHISRPARPRPRYPRQGRLALLRPQLGRHLRVPLRGVPVSYHSAFVRELRSL